MVTKRMSDELANQIDRGIKSAKKDEAKAEAKAKRSHADKKHDVKLYFSERDIPLVYHGLPRDRPVLTVENYSKWYRLYLVHPDGRVDGISFPERRNREITDEVDFVDHVPNPRTVEAFCVEHDYHIDDVAFEMMVGRWECDIKNNYEFDESPAVKPATQHERAMEIVANLKIDSHAIVRLRQVLNESMVKKPDGAILDANILDIVNVYLMLASLREKIQAVAIEYQKHMASRPEATFLKGSSSGASEDGNNKKSS